MSRMGWRSVLLLWCVVPAFLAGCGEEDASSSDVGDGADAYDAAEWFEAAADYRDALDEEYAEIAEEHAEFIDALYEGYEEQTRECEFRLVDDRFLQVRCPLQEELRFPACPYNYLGTGAPARPDEDGWYYCMSEGLEETRECERSPCTDGLACEGALAAPLAVELDTSEAFFQWVSLDRHCVAPEFCVAVREREGIERVPSCYYADRSVAETGVIPEVECSELQQGECAINCPCESADHCFGLSEDHPVGMCTDDSGGRACIADILCSIGAGNEGKRCVTPLSEPQWYLDFLVDSGRIEDEAPFYGVCVEQSTCEQVASRYPGVWDCAIDE